MARTPMKAANTREPKRLGEVQSLVRGLALLEAFADFNGAAVTLNELSLRTGLSPSTTHRLLATLLAEGYVTQDRESSRYLLGHRIAGTAATIQQRTAHLRALARPHLETIAAETGETTSLVVLDDMRSVYIDMADGTHALRMAMRVGSTFPAHTSASAKAILAHQRDEEALNLIFEDEPLRKLAKNTIVTAKAFKAELQNVLANGYAVEDEELEDSVSCIAAPILVSDGVPVAAISVPGPTARVLTPDASRIGDLVKRHAEEMSRRLGYRPAA